MRLFWQRSRFSLNQIRQKPNLSAKIPQKNTFNFLKKFMLKNKKLFVGLLLSAIILLALLVRFYNIDQVPSGIYPDEAVNGIDAYKVLHGLQPFQWFYPDNQGREGLFMNLIALSFSAFGISVFSLKCWSILFGALTALGTYFLTKELTRSKKAGLIAAFLVATSFWAINFSRISFRANMLPFVLAWSSYFLLLGLRLKNFWPFVVGGLVFGVGMHTYIAFRIAPAIFIGFFFFVWISRERFVHTYWKHALVFLGGFLLAAAPMFWTFYQHPEYLESRSGSISVFSPNVNQGHPWLTLGKSFLFTVQQYTFVGDMNWRHNYPPYPLVNPIVAVAFLIGFCMLLKNFFRTLWLRIRHGTRDRRLEFSSFLLLWMACMHAPEFLTFEGIPHALRAIGALPAVFIIATLPFLWLLDTYAARSRFHRLAAYTLTLSLLFAAGTFDIVKYHVYWANAPQQYRAFQSNVTDIARFVQTLPRDERAVFVTGNMERIVVNLFNADRAFQKKTLTALSPDEALRADFATPVIFLFSALPSDELLSVLRTKFGNIEVEKRQERLSEPYYIVRLE